MGTLQRETNNPLNLRYNPSNSWKGQVGEVRGFCKFKNIAYGFRAAWRVLNNYLKNGHNTIEKIISRWAPPKENDTENYIKFVCDDTLISRHMVLKNATLHDYWTLIMILRAMAKMESGEWFDEQQINLYINYPQNY